MTRKHVLYSGHVQGVGFRATCRDIARGFDVAGFVKNLPDGRVELVAEGASEQVEAFLAAVADRLGGHVDDARVTDEPPRGLDGFRVDH